MYNLYSPKEVNKLLNRHNLKLSKKLGQNFIIDKNIVNKLIACADLKQSDCVLEIGSGIGTLTKELAVNVDKVLTIEIDTKLKPLLNETLSDYSNVNLIFGNVLKLDLLNLAEEYFGGREFKVIANLPYYITSLVIFLILGHSLNIKKAVLMIQKEVAQRINAIPGTEEFGALSLAVQYRTKPNIKAIVPPTVFMPQPKVESAIIVFDVLKEPAISVKDEALLFNLIKAAFSQRRKKLLNALSSELMLSLAKDDLIPLFKQCGIDLNRRGETLTLQEFGCLANSIIDNKFSINAGNTV